MGQIESSGRSIAAESLGNTLSKTTSSGMTNDGVPLHTRGYGLVQGGGGHVGGRDDPNNILNMLTKLSLLIYQVGVFESN